MTTAATTHRTKTIFQESLEPPFLNDDHRLGYLAGRGGDDDAIDIFFTGREVAFLAEDVSVSPALKRAGRLHLRQLRRRLRSRDGYDSRRRPSRSASCSFVLGRHRAGRQSWLLGQSRFDGRGWAELAARSTVPAASELVVSIVVVHLCRSVSIAHRPKSLISLPSLTKFPTSQLTHNRLRFDLRDATQRRGVSPRRLAQSRRNCADPHHGKRAVSFAAGTSTLPDREFAISFSLDFPWEEVTRPCDSRFLFRPPPLLFRTLKTASLMFLSHASRPLFPSLTHWQTIRLGKSRASSSGRHLGQQYAKEATRYSRAHTRTAAGLDAHNCCDDRTE